MTASASLALLAGTAGAQVTVGQLTPAANPPVNCDYPAPYDEFNTSVAAGASYTVPAPGGVLTSWSTNAGPGAGQLLELKVIRPTGAGSFTVVGADGLRALAPSVVNTFPINIPVQAGDIVGLHVASEFESAPTSCYFDTTSVLDRVGWREGFHPLGSTFSFEEEGTEWRMNVSATLLPPPIMTGIGPAAGSITGGTPVVVTGANFASVKGVTFGTTPVPYVVNSEGQITATAPASKTLGKVTVSVTTAAGAVTSATPFTYEGCAVPKLNGKKLKASKKKLKKSDCKLGKVKKIGDATAKTGKVSKQNPKPGAILPPGTKVTIKLK
ncbi:MAG TPA: IPT/TIG domain-containing protein [Solirubrobacterales bacterium]|nr:IPT/TIG domain-containing protein [Solirubrobacterales bacterium]